jgi:hypothetical protein
MNKPRIVKDYEKLPDNVIEQLKLVYPMGFTKYLVSFMNKDGEKRMGLPFETEDYYYLIRMSKAKAEAIVEDDEDFDDEGRLKSNVKSKLEDKHIDESFLHELNDNEDNDLGMDDDDMGGEDIDDDL